MKKQKEPKNNSISGGYKSNLTMPEYLNQRIKAAEDRNDSSAAEMLKDTLDKYYTILIKQ